MHILSWHGRVILRVFFAAVSAAFESASGLLSNPLADALDIVEFLAELVRLVDLKARQGVSAKP